MIKIFREVFVVQPDFNKIPDMCVKMIRRVNDEDGIKVSIKIKFNPNKLIVAIKNHSLLHRHVIVMVTILRVLDGNLFSHFSFYKIRKSYMSRVMRKPTFWFPTWSDTNQAVQLQKMAKGLKFWI